jgi:uncharacterized protein YciW
VVDREDVEGLREAGFDDEEILSIVLITGLVNFMNRLAQGLGVDVPQAYLGRVLQWLGTPARDQAWLLSPP